MCCTNTGDGTNASHEEAVFSYKWLSCEKLAFWRGGELDERGGGLLQNGLIHSLPELAFGGHV